MVQVVIRYSLSPFRVWLNRDYGLTTGADGKSGCWLLTLECMEFGEEAARGVTGRRQNPPTAEYGLRPTFATSAGVRRSAGGGP